MHPLDDFDEAFERMWLEQYRIDKVLEDRADEALKEELTGDDAEQ